MRILVCGSRKWKRSDKRIINDVLYECETKYGEYHLIQGGCSGADQIAHTCALDREMISTTVPARWSRYGNSAGPKRNEHMLKVGKPNLVLAFHDDIENSKGTGHMVKIAREAGVSVLIIKSTDNPKDVAKWLK